MRPAEGRRKERRMELLKWISVKEKKPEPGERVLATDGIFAGEAYRTSANSWYRHTGFPWRDGVTGRTVAYWMPMPEPPMAEIDDEEGDV